MLLRSDVHTLFDLHLIGIDDKHRVVVSSELSDPIYTGLQGKKIKLPKQALQAPNKTALKQHLAMLTP
jgi:predicted restriction endonuclease